jgi:hypothetical protein
VLKSILFLRLLCTHPSMVLSKPGDAHEENKGYSDLNASGKLVALVQLLSEAGIYYDTMMAADSDSTLIYCNENDPTPDAYHDVISFQSETNLGQDPDARGPPSRSKCLIFSQFTATLDIVEELLFKRKMPSLRYMRLDGRVPMEKRAEVAELFNHDLSVSVMLLTTRVGGLGLNLTGADIVIFMEIDFNPFVDLQAMVSKATYVAYDICLKCVRLQCLHFLTPNEFAIGPCPQNWPASYGKCVPSSHGTYNRGKDPRVAGTENSSERETCEFRKFLYVSNGHRSPAGHFRVRRYRRLGRQGEKGAL